MGSARFILANLAETATVKNGSGGGAPARDETTPYTMENALNADRLTPWLSAASPAATLNFDIDLGSSKSISGAALLGFRPKGASAVGNANIQSGSGTYPGSMSWTTRVPTNFSSNQRDVGSYFNAVSARYWRVALSCTGQFSLGRIVLGVAVDLGFASGPGAVETRFQNRIEQPLPNGVILTYGTGDPGAELTVPVETAGQADKDTFDAIAAAAGSVVYFGPDGDVQECVVAGARADAVRTLYLPADSRYSLNLRLLRLP